MVTEMIDEETFFEVDTQGRNEHTHTHIYAYIHNERCSSLDMHVYAWFPNKLCAT